METNKIKTLWEKGKQINKNTNFKSKLEMETILTSKTLKTNRSIKMVFYMAAVFQAMGIGIHIINLFKYRQDSSVFNLVVFALIMLILSLFYTFRIQFSFTKTILKSQNLKEALLSRIEFYKQKYNLWLIAYSFSFIMLLIGVNMLVSEYQVPTLREDYPIYIINLIGFFIIYFTYRSLNVKHLKEYTTYLLDLENGSITDLENQEKKYRKIKFIFLAAGVILMLIVLAVYFLVKNAG